MNDDISTSEVVTSTESEVAKQPEPNIEATAAEIVLDETKQDEPAKTFTQEEVDSMFQKRLAKESRKIQRQVEQQFKEQIQQVEPQRQSFADDDEYLKAVVKHEAAKLAKQQLAEMRQAEKQEKIAESFFEKAERVAERHPDFQEVINNPNLAINDAMAEYIADSDLGAEVAYFLGKNPVKAAQIANYSPVKAGVELAKIEAELASKPQQKTSKAPPPINPVGIRGKSSSSTTPSDDDDIATWMQKERKRLRG